MPFDPNTTVASELMVECSPSEFVQLFLPDLMIAGWAMSAVAKMMAGMQMPNGDIVDAIEVIGWIVTEGMSHLKRQGGDADTLGDEAFALFQQRLGDRVKAQRDISAGEQMGRDMLAHLPPIPNAA